MNMLQARSEKESIVLNRVGQLNAQAFAESRNVLSQRQDSVPANLEAMAFWSRIYDLRGGALQPWDGLAYIPGSMKSVLPQAAQTARAVEDAVVAERNRLARELHDSVTQTLFAASLIAELLPELWEVDEEEARRSTQDLRQLTRGALAEMRTLLFELRPAALHQARLPDLLKQLSESVMGRKGIPIHLNISGDFDIPCDVKVELYRIVQESLNNIVKYARATRVDITVRIEANHVAMEIKDDGIGFDPTGVKPTSLGLRIMRERAEAIHGDFQIVTHPGMGTTVRLDWHL